MKEKMVWSVSVGISSKQLFVYFNFKCAFTSLPSYTNYIRNWVQTAGEVFVITVILFIQVLIRQTSREVPKNYPPKNQREKGSMGRQRSYARLKSRISIFVVDKLMYPHKLVCCCTTITRFDFPFQILSAGILSATKTSLFVLSYPEDVWLFH